MKTIKQVMSEFHRIQKQLIIDGSVDLHVYKSGNFWTIEITRYTFTEEHRKIATKDSVEWMHHSYYDEEDEQKNMAKLAEFKKKFNLK